jgi:Domain of unknown function (DUF222)
MPEVSFPGDGQDGEQPPPGVPARDEGAGVSRDGQGRGGSPDESEDDRLDGAPAGPEAVDDVQGTAAGVPEDDDWDPDAEMAAYIADLDAGRARIPEEWEIEGLAASISLGDAADIDPAVLAAMVGPDGLGGEIFAPDRPADVMPPGPVLSALTEGAAGDPGRLTDNQLFGAMSAARRLAARAEFLELAVLAEFTRRRESRYEADKARNVRPGRRDGEFAADELGMELVTSPGAARDRMDLATDLATRLPATRAGLAAGVIDGYRAHLIWRYTRILADADAATADAILAAAAPALRYDQLARKALALAMKLDPEAVKRGKDEARTERQRVEAAREDSGNASLSGRELAVGDVLASKAHIDALAAALRRGGVPGTLRELRVLVYLDLTQGRNPQDRLTPGTATDAGSAGPADPGGGAARDGEDDDGNDGGGGPGNGPDSPGGPSHTPAPFPALINLIVPAGTLFGWSTAPGETGGWGLTDHTDTARLIAAAAADPRTRWCTTLTGPDGTAIAHGCARGPHLWTPTPPGNTTSPSGADTRDGPGTAAGRGPNPQQAAELIQFLRELNITLTPIAKGTCDHRHAEDRYTPSRKLGHLIRARTVTCPAPGCGAQAYHNDLDHTVPYPAGTTDECNLGPPCRHHHHVKQAPGWTLEQPQPGVMRWTTPSGRVYATHPTIYET